MATAREYFERDVSNNLRVGTEHTLTNAVTGEQIAVSANLALDFLAGAKYGIVYVPECGMAATVILQYLENMSLLRDLDKDVQTISGFADTAEAIDSRSLTFLNRLVAYTPSGITAEEQRQLQERAHALGVLCTIRDRAFFEARNRLEHPLAFISHDSRDKEPFVRNLAVALQKMLCPVWYDEFSLRPGDSLRASIERGLKQCRKCIIVLSPNFFSNEGWGRREFDSIYTREILEKQCVMLPVWHNVTKEQVYEYCPVLLDRLGTQSSLGADNVARALLGVINSG